MIGKFMSKHTLILYIFLLLEIPNNLIRELLNSNLFRKKEFLFYWYRLILHLTFKFSTFISILIAAL